MKQDLKLYFRLLRYLKPMWLRFVAAMLALVLVSAVPALFAHLQRQPLSFFDSQPTGELMSRLAYDVDLLQRSVTGVVTGFFKDSFTVIGLSGVLFYREWR